MLYKLPQELVLQNDSFSEMQTLTVKQTVSMLGMSYSCKNVLHHQLQ